MNPDEVIAAYIDDTVRLLPSRLRRDVATELQSLLNEGLQARADSAGTAPDAAMALALVREMGRPEEVAARYTQPAAIIDSTDSSRFLRAAVIGIGVLVLLAAMRAQMSAAIPSAAIPYAPLAVEPAGAAADPGESVATMLQVGILAWLGVLVVIFGIQHWMRRRWPHARPWRPRDRDRMSLANRIGSAVVIPLAAACIVLYAAPTWVLDLLSRGRFDTSWSAYTEEFRQLRLPCFILLLSASLATIAYTAICGRWTRFTRRLGLGLNMALVLLVMVLAVDGGLFESSHADAIARDVLAAVALFYLPLTGMLLYAELGRVDGTAARPV